MKWLLVSLWLMVLCQGCVNDFVGNSPNERKHRKQLELPGTK